MVFPLSISPLPSCSLCLCSPQPLAVVYVGIVSHPIRAHAPAPTTISPNRQQPQCHRSAAANVLPHMGKGYPRFQVAGFFSPDSGAKMLRLAGIDNDDKLTHLERAFHVLADGLQERAVVGARESLYSMRYSSYLGPHGVRARTWALP